MSKTCIHNTLPAWVENLASFDPPATEVVLWRQDQRDFKFTPAGRIYFKLNDDSWNIVGRGTFDRFEKLSIVDSWKLYGERNGCIHDLEDFLEMVNESTEVYVEEHSEIGCIHIRDVIWLPKGKYMKLSPELWPRGAGIQLCKYDFTVEQQIVLDSDFCRLAGCFPSGSWPRHIA